MDDLGTNNDASFGGPNNQPEPPFQISISACRKLQRHQRLLAEIQQQYPSLDIESLLSNHNNNYDDELVLWFGGFLKMLKSYNQDPNEYRLADSFWLFSKLCRIGIQPSLTQFDKDIYRYLFQFYRRYAFDDIIDHFDEFRQRFIRVYDEEIADAQLSQMIDKLQINSL